MTSPHLSNITLPLNEFARRTELDYDRINILETSDFLKISNEQAAPPTKAFHDTSSSIRGGNKNSTKSRRRKVKSLLRYVYREIGEHGEEAIELLRDAIDYELDRLDAFIPKEAPEYYKDRSDRAIKPVEFIRDVYETWLGNGLTRPHIKHLDPALYQALNDWLRNNPEPADFERILPKAPGARSDRSPRQRAS